MNIQLVQPNLNTVGKIGYCEEYAEDFFSITAKSPTAWAAWLNTKQRGTGNMPTDVTVFMWYSYIVNGVNEGHVTINVPSVGRIFSSPYQAGTTHAELGSIQEVEQKYDVDFVGWSYDINGVVVAEEDDSLRNSTIEDAEDNRQLFLAWLKRNPYTENGEDSRYIGWNYLTAANDIAQNQDNVKGADGRGGIDTMAQEYYKNGSKIPDSITTPPTQLAPGIYKVGD